MKHLKILGGLLIAYTLNSCSLAGDAEPTELPPITQEGKNTFGCKVNGKVWIPTGYKPTVGGNSPSIQASFRRNCNNVGICQSRFGLTAIKDNHTIIIEIPNLNYDTSFGEITIFCKVAEGGGVIPDNGYPYSFKFIYLDTIKNIAAGTFSFTIKDNTGKAINVTDGRFDVKFN